VLELRPEPADGVAARALFAEYMELVAARMGPAFVPSEEIFASAAAFAVPGAAWLVGYDDGRAVCCGGMRPLGVGVAEIKRMFVTAESRRRGHGRRLLAELERLAAERGHDRVRLLTTQALSEAWALYATAGYRVTETFSRDDHTDHWLEKTLRPHRVRGMTASNPFPERSDMDDENMNAAGDIKPDDATPDGADSGEDATPAPFHTPDEDPPPTEEGAQRRSGDQT
jgi:GNAT superfamily N-acetyltransferase